MQDNVSTYTTHIAESTLYYRVNCAIILYNNRRSKTNQRHRAAAAISQCDSFKLKRKTQWKSLSIFCVLMHQNDVIFNSPSTEDNGAVTMSNARIRKSFHTLGYVPWLSIFQSSGCNANLHAHTPHIQTTHHRR